MTDATTTKAWARLWATARPFARPTPRAGAWYAVVGETSGERAVLEVRGKRVAVHKKLLEIRPDRPNVFTVVVRSRESVEAAQEALGPSVMRIYAVCPVCTDRVQVLQDQAQASCRKCGHRGEVAWWETG
jgi:DNA-directed RNA polymerase subunit RPC12/RpoP